MHIQYIPTQPQLDIILDDREEHIQVEFNANNVLYVHVNDITVLRICRVRDIEFNLGAKNV